MTRRNLAFILLIVILIAHVALWVIKETKSPVPSEPICPDIDASMPIVALTFDDGPNAEFTTQVLKVLRKFGVSATFFVCGKNIEGNENLLLAIVNDGHELANHAYSHVDLRTLEPWKIRREFSCTQSYVEEVIPGYTLKYIRPPYGWYNETVLAALREPMVLWDVDSGDWCEEDPAIIRDHVVSQVKSEDIIIMHDSSATTVEALKSILSELKSRGFQFITILQLAEYRSVDMRW